MIYTEFAQVYPASVSEQWRAQFPQFPYVAEAQAWSQRFGTLLHCRLAGERPDATLVDEINRGYTAWLNGGFSRLLTEMVDFPDAIRPLAMSESMFHVTNTSLRKNWTPLLLGEWPDPRERSFANRMAGEGMAFSGMARVLQRQRFADALNDETLLATPPQGPDGDVYRSITGAIEELDSGIILNGALASKPTMLLLPAPYQFQRGAHRAVEKPADDGSERSRRLSANANYVVLDLASREVVGVQVRTKVSQSTVDEYDSARIIFIDGDRDFGTTLPMRYRRDKSDRRNVSWPGSICADRFQQIQMRAGQHSEVTATLLAGDPGRGMAMKALAGVITRKYPVKRGQLEKLIFDRVSRKLEETRA